VPVPSCAIWRQANGPASSSLCLVPSGSSIAWLFSFVAIENLAMALTAAALQGPDVLELWKKTGSVDHENGGRPATTAAAIRSTPHSCEHASIAAFAIATEQCTIKVTNVHTKKSSFCMGKIKIGVFACFFRNFSLFTFAKPTVTR
jgi:hypothetical protein